MSQKPNEDVSASWADPAYSLTFSIFAREDSLDEAFRDVRPSSN